MEQATRKKSFLKRLVRIVLKTVLYLFLFFVTIILLVLTPPVQNFLRKKAVSYLEKKLDTRVSIGSIYIGLPKKVVIEDIYIEDRQQDTLLFAKSLKVDIGILNLLLNGNVDIHKIELKNSTAKIKRQLPDTAFNFQFIVDAFSPPKKTTTAADTSSSPIAIHNIILDNVRLVYKDVVTGNDATAWLGHFDTRMDKIDPEHLYFDIPETNIDGLTATVYQVKPLAAPEPMAKDVAEVIEPLALRLDLKKIGLQHIQLNYRNDASALYSNITVEKTAIKVNELDLSRQLIDLHAISLENADINIRLEKKETAVVVIKETKKEIATRAEAGWRILASSINVDNTNLRFDNDNAPALKKGMDYAHLDADSFTLHAKDFVLSNDSIGGTITEGRFKEQSGFVLEKLETRFLYTDQQAYLKDLHLITPGTDLKRDAAIQYASLDALQNDIGNMRLDADIANSKILVKDILYFVPSLQAQPAFADPSTTWYINSRINGRVADMRIDVLQIQGLSNTKIDVSGTLAGLPDMKKVSADIVIRNISSSKRDIDLFAPAGTLPDNITLPGHFSISGKAKGNTAGMKTDVLIKTDLGNASVKGDFQQFADPERIMYDATVQTSSLDLATLLQQKEMPSPVTGNFTVKGRGTDPKTANAVFTGKVQSTVFQQYTYHDLDVNGSLSDQQLKMNTGIVDPNIHFALDAEADLSKEYPSLVFHAMIDSIKTQPLHLTPNAIIYRGRIEGNFPVTDPKNLQGSLFITQALLVYEKQRVKLDTVQLLAGNNDSGHYVSVKSDIVNAELSGRYDLASLGNIFQQTIQPYFAVQPASAAYHQPYDFRLNGTIVNSPALKTFIPDLEKLDSVSFESHFSDTKGWTAVLTAPVIDIGVNRIRSLQVQAGTVGDKIDVKATLKQLRIGTGIEIDNAALTASLANNNIDFILNIKDKALKDKYNLHGLLKQPSPGNYTVSLQPENLVLNYDAWNISANNKIIITGNKINASELILSKNGQQLKVTSLSENANAPMEAVFDNFKLVTLTGLVQADSTLADGTINGKLTLIDLSSNPVFTGDLTINDLRIQKDTVGNLRLLVNNKVSNTYYADIALTGKGNDLRLAGNYYPLSSTNNFDFTLDMKQLQLTTAQAFSMAAIRNSSGYVNGQFAVKGTLDKPSVNGDLNFNKAAFNFSMLNSYFSIDQEKIEVNNNGIRFDDFIVKDSLGNQLRINGTAATSNFQHYTFDMRLRATNFQALNSTKKDNKLFYGKLFFNTNLSLKGTDELPVVDGQITVNEKTKMTIVLPQQEPGVADREGIVEFVDMDAPIEDSLFLAQAGFDSLNTSAITGMDVSINLEVNQEAEFSMIIDEANGDFLNIKGEALLNAGIDPSGKITLTGSYDLEGGSYELTFNFLRRKFDIEKGSKIIWDGVPTSATVDIAAKYVANAAPLDLVKDQLGDVTATERNTYLQKLPFDVSLKMEGELLKPLIKFDIVLPDNKSYIVSNDIIVNVRNRLDQLRQEEGEMNKQVFSLLLLNRFVTQNPFNSSENAPSVAMLARQSVSKLLTEQLNRLADDLVAGVDLNFDIISSEDYTTGERRDRTDLNVGLSKKLLNDKITISVGSNFELEGPQNSTYQASNIAGNVAIDYQLSRDRRYLLRAYRKNEYQGIIDGFVIETGVAFIITLDYNKFSQIFRKRRTRTQQPVNNPQTPAKPTETTEATAPLKKPEND